MKKLLPVLLAVAFAVPLCAQQSVIIKEPAGQCYQDLKANLPEAIRWDDQQMMVSSRPLLTTMSGNFAIVARIFPQHVVDKKTKEKVEACELLVAMDAPEHSTAANALTSSQLFQIASLMKARIESAMKARQKKGEQ